ncbi:MAG: D-2-hydroxyacid dehydrogenase [Oscillospiraceae bacterium]
MNILVCQPVTEEMKSFFTAQFPNQDFAYSETPTTEQFAEAEVIFGYPEPAMMKYAKKLRFLQLASAGAEKHNSPDIVPLNVPVCCSTGIFGREIGEVLLADLLALYKHLHIYRDRQRAHNWAFYDFNRPVSGSRVLILGLGDIGMGFAGLLKPFGCTVIGVRRTAGKCPDNVNEVYTMEALDGLLPHADIVAMCLPDTPATRGIMTRERIYKIKEGAVLLNVGRGNALDTLALADAVREGHLSGAAIDVVDTEPLPPEHPIWDVQNIIVTPHTAGRSFSPYIVHHTGEIFVKNLTAFLEGKPLLTPVDRATGYMKSRG